MEIGIRKPDSIFVSGIGEVSEGQTVEIPGHRIMGVDGKELSVLCDSTAGRVYFVGGVPYFRAVVECNNANELGVPIQCCRRWSSD